MMHIFFCLMGSLSIICSAMDLNTDIRKDDEIEEIEIPVVRIPTAAESRTNKQRFIRNTFTKGTAWRIFLEEDTSLLAYRELTEPRTMPTFKPPTLTLSTELLVYAMEHNVDPSQPTLIYEHHDYTCIGCDNTSIHILFTPQDSQPVHLYIPPCHNRQITGIAPLASNVIAVAGSKSITLCNAYGTLPYHKRITFNFSSQSINNLRGQDGALIIQTTDNLAIGKKRQYILYPYDVETYPLLRGRNLNDSQLEVVFQAAYALHKKRQLQLTEEENIIYEELPKPLYTLINHFLERAEKKREAERAQAEAEKEQVNATLDALAQELNDQKM